MSFSSRSRSHLRELVSLRQSELDVWHGVQFVISLGVPALLGILGGHLELGFIGGLAGNLFCFSDAPAPLVTRLLRLLEMLAAMLLLGIAGEVVGAHSPLFWALLVALVWVTGWLQLASHPLASALRWGAIALVSTATLPPASLTWSLAAMVCFAALVNGFMRFLGDRFFPNAAQVLPPLPDMTPRGRAARARFCGAYALAAALSMVIGQARGVTHPMWIATTTLLVMQPDARSSFQRILGRAGGTIAGVGAAALSLSLFHSNWTLFLALLALSYAAPFAATRNYALQSVLVAWLVLLLYDFASPARFDPHLLGERIIDVSIGCVLALLATIAAFAPFKGDKLQATGGHLSK